MCADFRRPSYETATIFHFGGQLSVSIVTNLTFFTSTKEAVGSDSPPASFFYWQWQSSNLRGNVTAGRLVWYPSLGLNRVERILISPSCNFFSGSSSPKNSKVKCAWPGAI
jgi:hypothetical protein